MANTKQILLKYLKSQNLMTLATNDKKPWVASVYYVIDEDFNPYFLSEPDCKHCSDIKLNVYVAVGIADSSQKVTDKKVGVQMQGTAIQITDIEQIKQVLDAWNKANPGFENVINFENIEKGVIKSKVYRIKPKIIKFLNEELYGPEGFKIFKF